MILSTSQRPLVLFNPANKSHRDEYAKFIKSKTWGGCPYRFAVEGDAQNNNLAYAMQRKLVAYYMAKEFKIPVDDEAI